MSKDYKITQKCYQVTIIRYLSEDAEQIEFLKNELSSSASFCQNDRLLALLQFVKEFDASKENFRIIGVNRGALIESLNFKKVEWLDLTTDYPEIRIQVEVVLTAYVEEQEFVDEFQRCFYDDGWMPGNFQVKLNGDQLP